MAFSPAQSGKFAQATLQELGLRVQADKKVREDGPYKGEVSFTPVEMKNGRHLGGVIQINDGTRILALTVSTLQQSPTSHVVEYQNAAYTEGGKTINIDLTKDNAMNRQVGERFMQAMMNFGRAIKDPQAELPFVDHVLADTMKVTNDGTALGVIKKVAHDVELAGKPDGTGNGASAQPKRAALAAPRM